MNNLNYVLDVLVHASQELNKLDELTESQEQLRCDLGEAYVITSKEITKGIINNLFDLKRYDVKLYEGMRGNSVVEMKKLDGKYLKYDDVMELINKIKISNNL